MEVTVSLIVRRCYTGPAACLVTPMNSHSTNRYTFRHRTHSRSHLGPSLGGLSDHLSIQAVVPASHFHLEDSRRDQHVGGSHLLAAHHQSHRSHRDPADTASVLPSFLDREGHRHHWVEDYYCTDCFLHREPWFGSRCCW